MNTSRSPRLIHTQIEITPSSQNRIGHRESSHAAQAIRVCRIQLVSLEMNLPAEEMSQKKASRATSIRGEYDQRRGS
jgi:hypothetical protein